MNNFEKALAAHPNLKLKYVVPPADHFGGCVKNKTIFINRLLSVDEQYQWLQEELAHVDYTVGNIAKCDSLETRKQERLARSHAMERTVTLDGLIECFNKELWTPEEIADYFGVTVQYLQDSLENYKVKRGPLFYYKDYCFDLMRGVNISRLN